MKKLLLIIGVIFCAQTSIAQEKSAFQDGEWFKFKMSYSGWLKAGEATLKINEKQLNGKTVYHVVGKGKTTGLINAVFKGMAKSFPPRLWVAVSENVVKLPAHGNPV